jgi:hypothetical protein
MRDGLVGIVATMLLGLGLASTLPARQAPDAQPAEQQRNRGATPPRRRVPPRRWPSSPPMRSTAIS